MPVMTVKDRSMRSSKAVVPPKARLRREVVQAAAGVDRRVGALQEVKRDCSGPDQEVAPVDAATYQHPGVRVLPVDRLTVEHALKSGSHPPALVVGCWGGGWPWRLETEGAFRDGSSPGGVVLRE